MKLRICCILFLISVGTACPASADVSRGYVSLTDGLRPFLEAASGHRPVFELTGRVQIPIDGHTQTVTLRLSRYDDVSFDLEVTHADYAIQIRRRASTTTLILPRHDVAWVAEGDISVAEESLAPAGILDRLVSPLSGLAPGVQMLSWINVDSVDPLVGLFAGSLKAVRDAETQRWKLTPDSPLQFPETGQATLKLKSANVRLTIKDECTAPLDDLSGLKVATISRAELEKTLVRGVRRATEILRPAPALQSPTQEARKVPHGELRWIDGHRVVVLDGTPEQIGEAHGQLLKQEATRCIESVLYTFGTVHVIRTGRWFRQDLEAAYARLEPHIPERHKRETRAMAVALQVQPRTAELLNVFPELFHCSGFAVFNSATVDGKLYHGRVLDYMTTIGLQDAATTFVVKPKDYIPFVNVGYGGFVGSVSGMNAMALSLGEMGGHGEGRWDGVPMATLMRRALEECSTLKDVMKLWTDSPRTCEYYYVFADGKTNEAVGVAAVPEAVQFIHPGEQHERLGPGISDAVVLSAGSRLAKLRERVIEKHGQIDAEAAMWLMSRPVAMKSNLHNVLFVPEDGLLYVANASHSEPAAERPYVRLNLFELLGTQKSEVRAAAAE